MQHCKQYIYAQWLNSIDERFTMRGDPRSGSPKARDK